MNLKMTTKKRWIAMGAGSALGIGLLAGGAVTAANAFEIEDRSGASIGVQPVGAVSPTTAVPFSTPNVSTFDDSDSFSSDSSSTSSIDSTPSAASVTSTVSAPSVVTPVSAPSVASPASPVSVQSPASVD
ncbi:MULTISPECIES: hypothetical protein [Cryobacterium]|uniref:Uncharacterized protein n=1 Tax=Cryobacterium serini TaxID=1259201 RepID=A0A4R9BUQ3_9MICO|nr:MULTISPECIES: hypothetical protein [Cryobacterium]TFD91395.1 hypothetical protein E3T51_01415 [Cryobacterium serini]